MSSADLAVRVFRDLESEDFGVLQAIEAAMSKHEYVPTTLIPKYARLNLNEIEFRLTRLTKFRLILRARTPYSGSTLTYPGYDSLAINALVRAEVLEAFGKPLGVGKEADVFDALSPNAERIAVKFHRLGRVSFQQVVRKRGYARKHIGRLFQSRIAAEREIHGMRLVFPREVAVPKPIRQNRHVVTMGMIEGAELSECKDISNPEEVLKEILSNVRKAYLNAGVIHADLSEYNVIVKPDGHVLIIDWPQYVTANHPNAWQLLRRDVRNIVNFFRRKYSVDMKLKEALTYVTKP